MMGGLLNGLVKYLRINILICGGLMMIFFFYMRRYVINRVIC